MNNDWRRKYVRSLAVLDAIVIVWAMSGALVLRFGTTYGHEIIRSDAQPYVFLTFVLSLSWWALLGLSGSRETTVLGYGTEEFKRVLSASFWLFGILAVISYALQLEVARGYVALALPAGVFSLFVARILVRYFLRVQRQAGYSTSSVLIIGGPNGAEHLARALARQPSAGYQPVATFLPGASADVTLENSLGLRNLGHSTELTSIEAAIKEIRPDAVALSSGVPLSPRVVRQLGWTLSDLGIKMILAPALTDVAGPRIHTQPVAGLPLIHVSTPSLRGLKGLIKRIFDIVGSSMLLIVLLPVFILIGIGVKLSSPGPIFYRQERVGIRGKKFRMIKFRSMSADADTRLLSLLAAQGTAGKPLFKVDNDPRITPFGRIIRKYSLDELPQLINVFGGSMSLVGPRPQREHEVALYEEGAHRRLYVSPGMSGLWQVSGRSNLSWEEAIQLDLYYVENWSLTQDIVILLKTFRAVFRSDGAI